MNRKRSLPLVVFCGLLSALAVQLCSADPSNSDRVTARRGSVEKDGIVDFADGNDEKAANSMLDLGNAVRWFVQFLPPRNYLFAEFPDGSYVDVQKAPDAVIIDVAGQTPERIQIEMLQPKSSDDAGTYEMRAEGDLRPLGNGTGGTVQEQHWAALMVAPTLDIDVDSDNNNATSRPDESDTEDALEEAPDDSNPGGKIVLVNDDDVDGDSVPDYVDGFNADGDGTTRADNINSKESFAELLIKLSPTIDPTVARLKVEYNSPSDPNPKKLTKTAVGLAPAPGRLRIWRVPGDQKRKPGCANATSSTGDFVPPGVYSLSQLQFDGNEKTLYLEGIRPSPSLAAEKITVSLDPDGTGAWTGADTVLVTVFQASISVASNYMVPGSTRNVIRYKVAPEGLPIEQCYLKVYDKSGKMVRVLDDLPDKPKTGKDFYEVFWNACKDKKSKKPLTESDSDYCIRLTTKTGGMAYVSEIQKRKVKDWKFSFRISDIEAFSGSGRSGINPDTISGRLIFSFQPADGIVIETSEHQVVKVNDAGKKSAGGMNVKVMPEVGGQRVLMYTTPTEPTDVSIPFKVVLQSKEGGALDHAANEWDMDSDAAGIQRKIEWFFFIDPTGAPRKLSDGSTGYDEAILEGK